MHVLFQRTNKRLASATLQKSKSVFEDQIKVFHKLVSSKFLLNRVVRAILKPEPSVWAPLAHDFHHALSSKVQKYVRYGENHRNSSDRSPKQSSWYNDAHCNRISWIQFPNATRLVDANEGWITFKSHLRRTEESAYCLVKSTSIGLDGPATKRVFRPSNWCVDVRRNRSRKVPKRLIALILNYKYLLEIIKFKFWWITTDVVTEDTCMGDE